MIARRKFPEQTSMKRSHTNLPSVAVHDERTPPGVPDPPVVVGHSDETIVAALSGHGHRVSIDEQDTVIRPQSGGKRGGHDRRISVHEMRHEMRSLAKRLILEFSFLKCRTVVPACCCFLPQPSTKPHPSRQLRMFSGMLTRPRKQHHC